MDKYEKNLRLQLRLNPTTWQTLSEQGVTSDTLLSLNFLFYAPNEELANRLGSALKQQGYKLTVSKDSSIFRRRWIVEGDVPPAKYALKIIDEWVTEMVIASKKFNSEFDGWGAFVPKG